MTQRDFVRADFDQIPVSIIFDAMVRTAFFLFVVVRNTVDPALPDEGSPDVTPNPVFIRVRI